MTAAKTLVALLEWGASYDLVAGLDDWSCGARRVDMDPIHVAVLEAAAEQHGWNLWCGVIDREFWLAEHANDLTGDWRDDLTADEFTAWMVTP